MSASVDGGLSRHSLGVGREQQNLHGGSIAWASDGRRLLLEDPDVPEGTRQALPGAISRIEVVGHSDDRNAGGLEGPGDRRQVDLRPRR